MYDGDDVNGDDGNDDDGDHDDDDDDDDDERQAKKTISVPASHFCLIGIN